MPPRTQESAIYTGPETSRSTAPAPGSSHLAPAVEIVPAPPLRARTIDRRWALLGVVLAFVLGILTGGGAALLLAR